MMGRKQHYLDHSAYNIGDIETHGHYLSSGHVLNVSNQGFQPPKQRSSRWNQHNENGQLQERSSRSLTPGRRRSDILENECSCSVDQSGIPPQNEVGMSIATDLRHAGSWRFVICQLLSGMTVAVNQIPECVGYALIAGVDPFHALQAAWIANIFTPLLGAAPGMVSGPSGLGAIAIRYLVSTHGPEYIFYSVICCGFCQVLFGALRLGKYLRLLPTGITIGMVNGMCLLLVALQLRYFKLYPAMEATDVDISSDQTSEAADSYVEPTRYLESTSFTDNIIEDTLNQPWAYFLGYDLPWDATGSQLIIMSVEAFVAMLMCYFFPKYIAIVPSSLLAILLLTGVNSILPVSSEWVAPTVGDYFVWETPSSRFFMGMFHPDYTPPPFNMETIFAVIPTGLSLFCINLLESLVAINVVDKYTSMVSEQDHVFYGQGVSNLVSGVMLGMGGTGLAHTSLLGLQMGGITHLCVFSSGIAILCALTFAYPAVAMIPLGALLGVALHLILTMIQTPPVLALMLKCTRVKSLVASDLFSTLITALFAILASTYGLVGYFIGVVCYACDPIAHAAHLNENEGTFSFLELVVPPRRKLTKMNKIIITQQLHHYDHRRDSDARNECMITAIPDRMPRRKSRYKEDDSSESSSVPERY